MWHRIETRLDEVPCVYCGEMLQRGDEAMITPAGNMFCSRQCRAEHAREEADRQTLEIFRMTRGIPIDPDWFSISVEVGDA